MLKAYLGTAAVGIILIVLGTYLSLTAESSEPAAGKTIITYATFARPFDIAPLVKRFEDAHPHIGVRVIAQAYYPKIMTMIGAGVPPDVMHIEANVAPSWIVREQYLDLTPYADEQDLADFYPNLLAPFRRGSELFGLPTSFSTVVLYYNRDMFDEAGVEYPDETWDWRKFLDAAKRLTRDRDGDGRIDQYGFVVSGWLNRYSAIIWQNGGELVSDDFSRCLLDTPQTIEALQWYADLIHKHRVSPTKDQSAEQGEMEMFLAGRAATFPATNFPPRQYRGMTRFRWDVAPLPRGKVRANTLVGSGNCVLRSTRHPDEAWKFVQFMSGVEMCKYVASQDTCWGLPPRRSVAESSLFLDASHPPANKRAFIDEIPHSRFPELGPVLAETSNLDIAMDELWYGRQSAERICREMARRLNAILDAARAKEAR